MSKPLTYSYQPCDLVVGSIPTSATFYFSYLSELKSNAPVAAATYWAEFEFFIMSWFLPVREDRQVIFKLKNNSVCFNYSRLGPIKSEWTIYTNSSKGIRGVRWRFLS